MNDKKYSVYTLKSPDGKIYVGCTSMVSHRWRGNGMGYKGSPRIEAAINLWGWDNFEKTVVQSGMNKDEAHSLERDLICAYKSTDEEFGYNLESGGCVGKRMHPTSIEKVRIRNLGHPVSAENIQKMRELKSKPVICLETGQIFLNSKEAGSKLNLCATSIGKNCNGVQEHCGGLHFAHLEDYKNNTIPKYEHRPTPWKPVLCITTGDVYENVCDASRKTGINRRGIAYACEGKFKKFKGMEWKYITRCVETTCYHNRDCICLAGKSQPASADACPLYSED